MEVHKNIHVNRKEKKSRKSSFFVIGYLADLDQVIKRAFEAGLERIIITAGTHVETIQALELCEKYGRSLLISMRRLS